MHLSRTRRPDHLSVRICCLLALVLVAGCVATPAAGLTIKDPFARPSPTEGGNGGAFLTIVNNGQQADRLMAAQSPAASMVELHETIDDNGVMRMRPKPDGFAVPAGGSVELKPGGKHIMLMGLKAPLTAGEKIEITLSFEVAGSIKVEVPVRGN